MKQITESELFEQIKDALAELSWVDFVEEANRILGTDYTGDEINWDT